MIWLRVPRPPRQYFDSLGLRRTSRAVSALPSSLGSPRKLYSQPSPPANITCGTPPSTAYAGLDHWPCRMLVPGELSVQNTLPVFLSTARKLGACGAGRLMCDFVDAVRRVDEQQVAGRRDRATAHVVLRHAQLLHHVQHPDDVGLVVVLDADDLVGAPAWALPSAVALRAGPCWPANVIVKPVFVGVELGGLGKRHAGLVELGQRRSGILPSFELRPAGRPPCPCAGSSFFTYVEQPSRFVLHRPVIHAVVKTLGVEADALRRGWSRTTAVAFDQRRGANALHRPVVNAAGGQLFAGVLPEEFAVRFVEAEQQPRSTTAG